MSICLVILDRAFNLIKSVTPWKKKNSSKFLPVIASDMQMSLEADVKNGEKLLIFTL